MTEEKKESQEGTERYVSKYLNLKLVVDPSYTKETGGGRVVVVPGKSIQFTQGVYETSDVEEIKFLDEHKNNGTIFIKVDENPIKARAELVESLEEREARIAEVEKKLGIEEKKTTKVKKEVKGKEEGAKKGAY